jgi:hypothetical protein
MLRSRHERIIVRSVKGKHQSCFLIFQMCTCHVHNYHCLTNNLQMYTQNGPPLPLVRRSQYKLSLSLKVNASKTS